MSQFLKHSDEYSAVHAEGIDFDDAVRLPVGGSTCDIYKTRWQRRDVFVKRLKEEYRAKPLYLDALDKEFDIGASLRHPSLPDYREFHRDYIVMDYIDGETLARMIRGKDPWLTKEKNIVSLLRQLVDVVDYLHRHNVVHCDIKPDNIMITANNRNLVLIDFDKSYTDALSDTSGHPGKYGLTEDEKGRNLIDFHGIGRVAEKLKADVEGYKFGKHKRFVQVCYKSDANCEDLREILASTPNRLAAIVAAGIVAAGLLIGIVGYLFEKAGRHEADIMSASQIADSVGWQAPVAQEEMHEEAKTEAAVLDQRIQPAFDELLAGLDRLNALKGDSTLTGQQLLDSIRHHSDIADEYIAEAFAILSETYPGLTEREAWRIMSYSMAYTGYTRRATPELRACGLEAERRLKAEGRSPQ